MALTAPQEAAVVITANSAEATMPKRTSLPSMLPPVRPSAFEDVVAVRFRPVANATPAMNSTPMTARIAQPWRWLPTMRPNTLVSEAPIAKIESICDEVRERGRVLERMRGIGVEEAAAIGAEHLDRDLRGDRADCDGLLGAFQRRRVDIGAECLRHALPDQEERSRARRSGCRM